ncbi:MAG: hypothetical protein GWN99_06300 [Gemmatimonadetes bacterium]|uniref:UDP-N-acetylglucosamine diphosphorylase/glucosamine-1-phosphate N-acetyltransferase n=1 Tax=Candidatus Kutchimonas denitrificans TaxID=3056748 RepID=A0AAE4Z9G6_9BACT|nr:hypothetical protein [Gemmatimonadota bacterium]NIR76235.1 hypothetical protein [Candidatus Kutchimonas denitrificans]NIS00675.1 hypothetical protein [Gemmatimonadota bacterium]NIT66820.1 hypothetical protein [Gemmatimonadota bacterium]NIV23419.1 hypothetical protein [Gemmatimonadota bacterium]
MTVGLVIFDDRVAQAWEPFALTRPAGELVFGAMTLGRRAERVFGVECLGHLAAEHLVDFHEPGGRPVLQPDDLPQDRDLIFWSARVAPDLGQRLPTPDGAATYLVDGEPAGFYAPAGALPDPAALDEPGAAAVTGASIPVEGRRLAEIWELMLHTPEQLGRDLAESGVAPAKKLPDGVYRQGDAPLRLAADVRIEPGTLFDTRDGPILIEEGTEIRAGTRLDGPARIGPRSRLLGGSFARLAAGPFSYLRGEVSETVVLGYSNKAHDGYLGHAYIGRWVNLGAFTTNSDLKNNYRPVRVWTPGGVQDTGQLKIGCFLGDHVKTGIGLLLGTGTVVGAGANVYGNEMPPVYVPPFSWGQGGALGEYRLPEFLEAAETVMARREVTLDERGRRHLERCWRRGRDEGRGG